MATYPVLSRYANMQVQAKQLLLDGLLFVGRLNSGKILYVSSVSGSTTNDGLSPSRPKATLAQALALCTANIGDIIYLMAGHAETISAATAISPAGVTIIGLGVGTARPTFTFDTLTSASFTLAVANVSITNCIFVANLAAIVTCFSLTTATDFTVTNCYFYDTATNKAFLTIITVAAGANGCDGLYFCDNVVKNIGTSSNNTTINSGATIDRLTCLRNNLDWAVNNDKPGLIDVTTGILTRADIGYNKLYRPQTTTVGGSLIKLTGTTSTGWVYNNDVQTLQTGSDLLYTTTVGLAAFRNEVTGAVGASGFLIPATDS